MYYNRKMHTHICTYGARAIQMHTHICTYGTCHKKRYKNHKFTKSVIHSLSVASLRISAESSKGIHRIIKGRPRNRQRVSTESSKGTCEFVARGECTPMLSMLAWLSNSSIERRTGREHVSVSIFTTIV